MKSLFIGLMLVLLASAPAFAKHGGMCSKKSDCCQMMKKECKCCKGMKH